MWIGFLLPSGRQRGMQKQVRPRSSVLREHQEDVAHRRREEPLVAGEQVLRAQAPSPAGSARVVLVRRSVPPCFSVMPMPTVIERFCASGRSARRTRSTSAAAPIRVQRRVARAAAGCRPWSSTSGRSSPTRSGCACTATRRGPRPPGRGSRRAAVGDAVAPRDGHHGVPGRVELDESMRSPDGRLRLQLGLEAVGVLGGPQGRRAVFRSLAHQLGVTPFGAAASDRAAQRRVAGVDVVVRERDRLVQDLMGGVRDGTRRFRCCHGRMIARRPGPESAERVDDPVERRARAHHRGRLSRSTR